MKKYIYLTISLFWSAVLTGQTLYSSRHDSIPATGSIFTLKASPYRGNIQWQSSTDAKTWSDLAGQTNSQVSIPSSTEAFYRARITDSSCFVTYTDSAVVLLPRTQNITINPTSLTGTALLKSDSVSYSYNAAGSTTVKPGTILLNTDSVSGIRVVSGTQQKGDTITVQTTQGTMADLFVNQSFKLSTAAASNAQGIKGLTGAQLSRALTDADGFIHPAAVIDNNPSASKAKSTTTQTDNIPLVSFGKDFSGETIYSNSNLLLQFSSGYYNFNSELKCEFQFEQLKFDLSKLKITGGALKRFSFYTDPDVTGIDAKLVLLAQASGAADFEKEKILAKNVFNKSFKFPVGEIPVWMDVSMDLMAKVAGEISSELSVTGGASASAHLKLGATYQNGVWTPDTAFVKTFTLEGPTLTGKANQKLQVEVYPHISVKFYKIVGPYLDIAPYTREEMNLSISGNYDFGMYGGTNARLGINVGAFDKNVYDWNHEFNLKEKELYRMPKKLKLLSGDNQEGTAGVALTNPIVLRALDSKDNPLTNYPVNIKSLTGTAADKVLTTDANGEVQVKWTLDNIEGDQKLEAYLQDGKDLKISTADTIIHAKICECTKNYGTFTDPRDGHVYKTITIGTQTWMAENLAYLPVAASSPTVGSETTANAGKPFYYVYDLAKYGVLYNWYAALTAAPAGWHLPSDAEWTTLSTYLGGDVVSGGKLKSSTGWYSPNTGATNSSCFSALPGGARGSNGLTNAGNYGYWWSSTEINTDYAWFRNLYCYYGYLNRYDYSKYIGFSVRCVRD